jgi:hypothetical protein
MLSVCHLLRVVTAKVEFHPLRRLTQQMWDSANTAGEPTAHLKIPVLCHVNVLVQLVSFILSA